MFDTKSLDDLARKLSEAIPPGLQSFRDEFEKNLRAVLRSAFTRMDLVSREEFDVQSAVLARTREKLEALEKQVAELEAKFLQQ